MSEACFLAPNPLGLGWVCEGMEGAPHTEGCPVAERDRYKKALERIAAEGRQGHTGANREFLIYTAQQALNPPQKYGVRAWVQRVMVEDEPALVGYLSHMLAEQAALDGYTVTDDMEWEEMRVHPDYTDPHAELMLSRGWVCVRAEAPVAVSDAQGDVSDRRI